MTCGLACRAVDHHTAEHMFTNAIKGTFNKCATILITHQLTFVRRCDKVAILDDGEFKVRMRRHCAVGSILVVQQSFQRLSEFAFLSVYDVF